MKNAIFFLVLCITVLQSCKKESTSQPTDDTYFLKVKTIVQNHCLACHVPEGEGRPVVLVSDSDIVSLAEAIKSATCDSISPLNRRMPPTGDLSDADKETITKWFEKGGRATD